MSPILTSAGCAGVGEFLQGDAAFGLEADIDERVVVLDGDDRALEDGAFKTIMCPEELIQEVFKAFLLNSIDSHVTYISFRFIRCFSCRPVVSGGLRRDRCPRASARERSWGCLSLISASGRKSARAGNVSSAIGANSVPSILLPPDVIRLCCRRAFLLCRQARRQMQRRDPACSYRAFSHREPAVAALRRGPNPVRHVPASPAGHVRIYCSRPV